MPTARDQLRPWLGGHSPKVCGVSAGPRSEAAGTDPFQLVWNRVGAVLPAPPVPLVGPFLIPAVL